MFTNHNQLKRKTPANGIGRKEYIGLLVDEFYETSDVGKKCRSLIDEPIVKGFHSILIAEAKEQISANLANFAYDPINYTYLREAVAIELFTDLLSSSNTLLVRHGIAGLCNLCLGEWYHPIQSAYFCRDNLILIFFFFSETECQQKILSLDGIRKVSSVLVHSSVPCVRDAIATLLQINSPETASLIFDPQNVANIESLRDTKDIPLRNLVSLYLATATEHK